MAAKGGGRRCMDGLPEEVLHEVLSRVGNVKDLFMLAVTCRRWLRRFTDPAFLRGLWGVGHRARLLGFFFQHQQTCFLSFLPAPGSPLRALTSPRTFRYAEPLAARRGVVLMMLTLRILGLCNPITGERHVLPPLERSVDDQVYTYAIVTAAHSDLDGTASSSSLSSGFSQLLVTTLTNDYKQWRTHRRGKQGRLPLVSWRVEQVCLHSYSAATRSWSAPTMCRDKLSGFFLVGERSAVVHQGTAHWLWLNEADNLLYTLSTEVGKERHPCDVLSMTKLPQVRAGGSPLLCVSTHGQLSVACVHPGHVTVWTQQQDAAWLRTAVIRIPMAVPNTNSREKWFDFNRGSMLALYRSGGVFVLDLDKKVMEKIMDDCLLPRFSHLLNETKSVAYEVDLVDFFLLRLGGLCLTE